MLNKSVRLELYVIVFQQKYEFIAVVSFIAGIYLKWITIIIVQSSLLLLL